MNLLCLRKELKAIADPRRAEISLRFFKTGKGEYGEGDVFLGITVPQSRKIAIKFKNLSFPEISKLLHSKIHEERLIALLILVSKFDQTNILENVRMNEKIFNFYLQNTKSINNWDLVDLSADKIVGGFLFARGPVGLHPRPTSSVALLPSGARRGSPAPATPALSLLVKLAKSKNLWERRIAMIATHAFIKNGRFDTALKIAEILLNDDHDLIQKAVGWMLREVGKRDFKTEVGFLNKHYRKMPRTMLRYAIEKFPEKLRKEYLRK